ncbi:MAG: DNA primase [Coriobacteriia bacterium]|nr:DNA primase [Coriobacteriia bacterium]
MGRIPDEDVAKVREATDIASLVGETVQLRRKGRLLWGLCPFHGEKTPSFKVDPGTQLWHCFGCGEGGDAFGFVMRTENVDFPEAIRILAGRAGIEVREERGERASRRERLTAACDAAAEFYHRVLVGSKEAGVEAAREYLASRGFGIDVAKRFRLGYAPGRGSLVAHLGERGFTAEEMAAADLARLGEAARDRFFERVMFPIHDLRGRCIGFGGRVMGEAHPKYLNTSETPLFRKSANLYAVDRAKNEIVRAGEAVVVEGYTDVIALHEAGLRNAVATLGTALTEEHLRMLSRFAPRIVYLFDGDEAGRRAADRAADMTDWRTLAGARGDIQLAVALMPGGKDPAEFVAEEGPEAMRGILTAAVPLARYALDRRMERHDLETPEGRSAALADAAEFLAPLGESLLGMDYRRYVAGRLMTEYETVSLAVRKAPSSAPRQGTRQGGAASSPPRERAVPPPLSPHERAEREVVRLLALVPGLRAEARELLSPAVMASERYRTLLERVCGCGGAVGGDLYARVREQDIEAAAELTGLLVDASAPARPDVAFEELLTKLKEYALERLILGRQSEMRAAEAARDRGRCDELFKETSALTLQLERLRRGLGGSGGHERDQGTSDG